MKKKISFYLAIAIFVVPLFIYFIGRTGKNNFKPLPYFGEKILPDGNQIKDTIYYTVPDFKLVSQRGDTISQITFSNSIYITNFFFASCKDVCPKMNAKIETVYKKIADSKINGVKFLSITVDPKNDSVQALMNYSKKFHANPNIWYFATGNKEAIMKAGSGFLLSVSIEDSTIDHSQQVLLIDKQNHLRGYYDGLDDLDISRLNEDIKVLLYEYSKQN